tara:strand:- start:147 stop:578 length:432 start_codon:yes stop_codon:yes gene_type:complete
MKKILLISCLLSSFNTFACPDIEGTYKCVDPNGKLYEKEIKVSDSKPIKITLISNGKKQEISTDYIERREQVVFDNRELTKVHRATCTSKTFIYEYLITDGLEISIRGSSIIEKNNIGYSQKNKTFLPFDKIEENREDCKKIN